MSDFENLFQENRDFIFKYLMKMTQNASLSEELTQETFFRAYMNYRSLRNKNKAPVWLCQIAKNTYFTWYNRQKKHAAPGEIEELYSKENIENALLQKERSQRAMRCLRELEDPYKEVFMLSVVGGFSLKEISFLFKKSESWARVTFYRARQKLKERMRSEDEL